MSKKLTWLHISDIHFHPKTEWRDSASRESLLEYLKDIYGQDDSLRPDLIFCTGDIAFGETGASPLTQQYEQAKAFFDSLLSICGRDGSPLPIDRLFVVPGNHDVNRKSINSDAQATLTTWARTQSREKMEVINQRFEETGTKEFKDTIERLEEYAQFIQNYLSHQQDGAGRHRYVKTVDINGLKVAIAGFNSAWTCAGDDDRGLWLAAKWQFNAASEQLKEAKVRIGLIHHPVDWLNEAERDIVERRITGNFHFWLHGHSHNTWVTPIQSHIAIGAGAVGAEASEEFAINIVSLNLAESKGVVHLHAYSPRDNDWVVMPVAKQAPSGQWRFTLPKGLHDDTLPPTSSDTGPPILPSPEPSPENESLPPKREQVLFGRDALLRDARAKLQNLPFLLVYGLRGNGKSALIEELCKAAPLAGKNAIRFFVRSDTTAKDLFQQFATLLGDNAEFPDPPTGNSQKIAEEVRRRYPNPRLAWVWIDQAHHLLDNQRLCRLEIRNLLLGMQAALGRQWNWVLELRERPVKGLLGDRAGECEVPGLDKNSLAECLAHAAPPGRESEWHYRGDNLKGMYQWLGGGHGNHAHPLAIQLLIEVARGLDETPLEVLKRHRGEVQKKLEEKLLGELFEKVLSATEQRLIQTLALYRSSIPHDHADLLEQYLKVHGAWDGIDRRCLLLPNPDHSLYYLHSFIAEWLRSYMGYADKGEDIEYDFAEGTNELTRQKTYELHSAIAACWLKQLGGSQRVTNQNISRALEAFHHFTAAGESDRIHDIAVKLLTGNLGWAIQRIKNLYDYLYNIQAPIKQQRMALEYLVILDSNDHKALRFLGECWAKEEGRGSDKARRCFEEACRLNGDFPPYWANLGRTLLAQGVEGASAFLKQLEALEEDCPQAINAYVRSIQSACLDLIGQADQATTLRMEYIRSGSREGVFYVDEAKARLKTGNWQGALEILDLADENGCASDFTLAIRTTALQQSGQADQAAALRMQKINAGSHSEVFYSDEAKTRLKTGDWQGALEILDLAEKNGCASDITLAIRTTALQQSGQAGPAAALRMGKIRAGSRFVAYYNDEAKARLEAGDWQGAMEILDLAEKYGCASDYTMAIRTTVLQHSGQADQAAALRMQKINDGSRNTSFYSDEAKSRLEAGDWQGALEILDLAEKNGCANDYTVAIRADVFQRSGQMKQATALRMGKIRADSLNTVFYNEEAKARLEAGDVSGALEILDLAEQKDCADHLTAAVRASALLKQGVD